MSALTILYITQPGPRPPFGDVADHLWGEGCNIDSDGNSTTPDDTGWTELTLQLRGTDLRVDVDLVSSDPLVLKVRSDDPALCQRTAKFIVAHAGGKLERNA